MWVGGAGIMVLEPYSGLSDFCSMILSPDLLFFWALGEEKVRLFYGIEKQLRKEKTFFWRLPTLEEKTDLSGEEEFSRDRKKRVLEGM